MTIAHALIRWVDGNGRRQMAGHGERVDLPEDLIALYAPLGAFEAEGPDSTVDTPDLADTDTVEPTPAVADTVTVEEVAPLVELPDRPRQTSTKAEWETYAAELHRLTDGRLGVPLTTAHELGKRELIATTNEGEHDNG
ncbi:hypothetical protein ACHIPZ_04975 [Antrihabitans sp. NCIMB 15449]|uniref:Uncharacterized protein n=1 Tax=Antrihabitans spumae TaxID=3373370 RepID=A0ABW7JKD1_9NOCA